MSNFIKTGQIERFHPSPSANHYENMTDTGVYILNNASAIITSSSMFSEHVYIYCSRGQIQVLCYFIIIIPKVITPSACYTKYRLVHGKTCRISVQIIFTLWSGNYTLHEN